MNTKRFSYANKLLSVVLLPLLLLVTYNSKNSFNSSKPSSKLNGYYTIQSVSSNLYLDAHHPDVAKNGCRVQLWHKASGANQIWKIESTGNGVYIIRNAASSRILDAHAPDITRNGCRVQLWENVNWDNQRWKINKNTDGTFFIQNLKGGNILDAHMPDVTKNGCAVQLWSNLNGGNQKWKIVASPFQPTSITKVKPAPSKKRYNCYIYQDAYKHCNSFGRPQTLVNRDKSNSYSVTVETSWQDGFEIKRSQRVYNIAAGGKINLGCSSYTPYIRGHTVRYKRKIVGEKRR